MIILPAVDLLDGNAVRLAQGKRDQVTIYSKDPVSVAKKWVDMGAQWLHVVDLNGAFEGSYSNINIAEKIIKACPINIEFSGGIRTQDTLEKAFAAGASRVVLGTKAAEDPKFVAQAVIRFKEKIAVAIDAKAGQVVSRGWVSKTSISVAELAKQMAEIGVQTIICTDVSRDGMLQGPNLELLEHVLGVGITQIIASGGVASIDDLMMLKKLEPKGVKGIIIGKALYEGTIDLKEALEVAR